MGKMITLSPCLSLYRCPLDIWSILSSTTTLLMRTAAVRRRVSLRMLSAQKERDSGAVSVHVRSPALSGAICRETDVYGKTSAHEKK